MTTTQNEIAVILALATNDFGNQAGDWVWANSINDARKPSGIEGKALSGVISSLVQKGLVETDGNTGRDACVRLTETGLELAASEMEPKVTNPSPIIALIDLANLTVQFANDAAAADASDLYTAGSAPELEDLSGPQAVAIYNVLAAELNGSPVRAHLDPIPTTKRFADKGTATKSVWGLIEQYHGLHEVVPATKPAALTTEDKAAIAAAKTPAPAKAATTPRRGTGINLAPLAKAYACREGSKQATLVDMLFRPEGATMAELLVATSGGKTPWKEVSVKSGLNWDMNKIKGYGIKTTKRGDLDCYHLVLPKGLTAPVPHTPKKGA